MVSIKPGDLVRLQFTGRLTDQSVFETTDEALAKQAGIWSSSTVYGPRLAIYGRGSMIAGLEEALLTLAPGQSGQFTILEDKAFGKRFAELVRVMPERDFTKHDVRPAPGLIVSIDGVPASVKSVSSGRVMLDFNHPLAGQSLAYDLHLMEVISSPGEKAKALAAGAGSLSQVAVDDAHKTVTISKSLDSQKARMLQGNLRAALEGWEIKIEG